MRETSVWSMQCDCGRLVETPHLTSTCPKCGRYLVVEEWPFGVKVKPRKEKRDSGAERKGGE